MNRRWLDRFLAVRGRRPSRPSSGVALILVDIDGLQNVNRKLGYSAGDATLSAAARRMAAAAGPGRTVVRFGGDEFVIPCEALALADIRALAARVIRAAAGEEARRAGGRARRRIAVSASAGIALRRSGGWGGDIGGLLDAAGRALHRAKAAGGGCVRWSWV